MIWTIHGCKPHHVDVFLFGAGAVIRSVLRGAQVIVVDIDQNKLDIARSIGATHVLNARDTNFTEQLKQLSNGHGPNVTIEAAGNSQTYRTVINEVAFSGRVVFIGYAGKEIAFQTHLFVQKELDIRGSRNAEWSDFKAVINYLRKTDDCDELISKVILPQEFPTAIKEWLLNSGSVMKLMVQFK
uniref:MS137, putative dehydrogenase n=1 Tax=Microscilla sp. PRE1 TaxID=155537 RepID=Q93P94_9BACT|nr:zinc-binding dehydrogenase [Microscilla sp. PRE1]AAK62859.1 MS137, putative dehydrogenase [Microscilla sp. PRE1]